MNSTSSAHQFEDSEAAPSPFRAAFGRARSEALAGTGTAGELRREAVAERPQFEYRLERRRGKRSADEADWNALGRKGWELVGVTGKHAAFKRHRRGDISR